MIHNIIISTCCKCDKLFNNIYLINFVLLIGSKVESDQKNIITSECFYITL